MERSLILAAKNNNLDEVRRLLEAGADVHAETDNALIYASNNGNTEVVRLLLEAGADVHARKEDALRSAAFMGRVEVVRVLLEAGADVHAKADGALRHASRKGHLEVVRLLLEAGADVHARGDISLIFAAEVGHLEVVRLLLEAGADIRVLDDGVFEEIDNPELRILLREYGANISVPISTEERRRAALEQEQKNEQLRAAALDEVKNREEKTSENPFIHEHCSSTENLYGDPLKNTDDIVVFELGGNKGDCYLKEEYVRGVGEKAYKLPWSNVWITKSLKEFAENMQGYGPLRLQRSEDIVGYNSTNILWVLVEN